MMLSPQASMIIFVIILSVLAIGFVISAFDQNQHRRVSKKLQRGSNYRSTYFKHNKGLFGKGIYFCPFCGKLLKKREDIQIDHITAIHRVQNSAFLSKRFKKLPDGVNDIKNLVHACARCNRRKGAKGGIWVFMGHFGQYFMPMFRYTTFGIIIYLVGSVVLFGG